MANQKTNKSYSVYNKHPLLNVIFDGKLKDEIIKRACVSGYNNEPKVWFKSYLIKLWKLKPIKKAKHG